MDRPKGAAAPAVAGIVVFGLLTTFYVVNFIRYRHLRNVWVWGLLVFSGGTMAGFGLRLAVHNSNADSLGEYIAETLFLLLPPIFLFLSGGYAILGHLARSMDPDVARKALIVPQRFSTAIFVSCDIGSFLIQGAGGGLSAAKDENAAKTGSDILLTGLAFQVATLAFFIVTMLVFGLRVRSRFPEHWHPIIGRPDWRVLWAATLVACIGYGVRSVYRVAEYAGGYFSYLATHEAYFYCLDSIPLALAASIFIFVWPPYYCQQRYSSFEDMQLATAKSVHSYESAA